LPHHCPFCPCAACSMCACGNAIYPMDQALTLPEPTLNGWSWSISTDFYSLFDCGRLDRPPRL
jgi:hypothetical protein